LNYELPKVNRNVNFIEKLVNTASENKYSDVDIVIPKSDDVMERIKLKADKGFSPSALNTYRNCSLQFYFQAIAGIKETDEVEETIGADTLGSIIHEVLEKLYVPFIGTQLSVAAIKEMKSLTETYTYNLFEEQYGKSGIAYGKNLLTIKVALRFINNFLNQEIEFLNNKSLPATKIISLETSLEIKLQINDLEIKIHGMADRIDEQGDKLRIIDYKTGTVQNKELHFDDWEDLKEDSSLAKSFQLLTYAWLYKKMNPLSTKNTISGIITFRELSSGLKTVKINNSEVLNNDVLFDFEQQLTTILKEIINPEIPFSQTITAENCIYCSFKGVCNR